MELSLACKKFTYVGGTQPLNLSMIKGKNKVYDRAEGEKQKQKHLSLKTLFCIFLRINYLADS